MGAIFIQKDDYGREHVVVYTWRSNNTAEANYSSYEGKALVEVWVIAHFLPYLYGQHFTLVMDHQPLW